MVLSLTELPHILGPSEFCVHVAHLTLCANAWQETEDYILHYPLCSCVRARVPTDCTYKTKIQMYNY